MDGVKSKATTPNPKDLLGAKKVSPTKFPAVAVLHGAMALMDGARKYGPYNWRDKDVIASIYVDAAQRHLLMWLEGEELASDSGVHHLGHALGCIAILLDAQANHNLIDDRPLKEGQPSAFVSVLSQLNERISNAPQERQQPEDNQQQHQGTQGQWTAPETSRRNSTSEGGKEQQEVECRCVPSLDNPIGECRCL